MDILYADGITSSDGLASTEFSFPQMSLDANGVEEPDPQDSLLRSVLLCQEAMIVSFKKEKKKKRQ